MAGALGGLAAQFGVGQQPGAPQNCPACDGKGGFDRWSKPCREGNMHFKMACQLCSGQCVVQGNWSPCQQCQGKGGFDTWDKPAHKSDMQYKTDCRACGSRGYV